MSHPLPADTLIGFHLRSPSSSGGKDWVGCLSNDGTFHRYWGKVGQVSQHQHSKGNHHELQKLVKQKQAKGYQIIDTFHRPDGWQSQQSLRSSSAKAKTESKSLTPTIVADPIQIKASSQHSLAWDF